MPPHTTLLLRTSKFVVVDVGQGGRRSEIAYFWHLIVPAVYLDPAIDLRVFLIINIRAQLVSNWRGHKAQLDPFFRFVSFLRHSNPVKSFLSLPSHTASNL